MLQVTGHLYKNIGPLLIRSRDLTWASTWRPVVQCAHVAVAVVVVFIQSCGHKTKQHNETGR